MDRRAVVTGLLAGALAGCGDMPQPFLNNPGAAARRLAQPPPVRLSVLVPRESLLPDSAAVTWARAMTDALVAQELPAVVADESRRGNWQLVMSAEIQGGSVLPSYTVENPAGASQGVTQGVPVPVAAWADAREATLKAAAEAAAPNVVSLLNRIEAARRAADPNDLVNRPARLYFSGVTGAPGDGNTALARQLRAKLAALGQVTQDTAKDADFSVRGEVNTAPGAKGTTRVEIQWVVNDAAGEERGRVVQLNEVPPDAVNRFWGDVAVVVAQEAAGGVKEVLSQQTGRRAPAAAKPAS